MFGGFGDPFADPVQAPEPPTVRTRLGDVREAVDRTCVAMGRDPNSVRLIGVTKTLSPDEIKPAIQAGLEDLGESYVQEAREKASRLPGVRWHLIGHLQRNKVNLAVDLFETIHSLDSASLIRRLDRRCGERGRALPGLIQVRLGGEDTKTGVEPSEVFDLLEELVPDPPRFLRLVGLMTIPPPSPSPDGSRPYFQELRALLNRIVERGYPFWHGRELSMGMSDDYLVAVEEGATMIRVGTAIFGSR